MYKALVFFRDTQDNNHVYRVGDLYPREGYEPTKERLESLSSNNNKQGKPVIELTDEAPVVEEKPKRGRKKKA